MQGHRALRRWITLHHALTALLLAWVLPVAALELSAQEKAWIASHGPVRTVVGTSFEPFYRSSAVDGRPLGYAIDMFQLLTQRAGLQVRYIPVRTVAEGMALLSNGQADASPFLRLTPDRRSLAGTPGSVLRVQTVFVTRSGPTLPLEPGLAGQKLALASGSVEAERVAREFPQARVEAFANTREAFEAVALGRADVSMANLHSAIWTIESNLLTGLQVRRAGTAASEDFGPIVSAQHPLLQSILAKALDTVTPAERTEIARRWLPTGSGVSFESEAVVLSEAERAWVTRAGEVRAGFDARFEPFTRKGVLGGFEGLGADLLRASANKTGLRIVEEQGDSFARVLQRARDGALNVVVGMARNDERAESFHFIGPFVSAPSVIVTRAGAAPLVELAGLGTGTLALLRQHFLMPQLRSRLPGLRLAEFDSQEEVLHALSAGKADAAIGNAHVINRLLEREFVGRLRVSGIVRNGDSELFFGVPKNQPELARVLDKGYAALTPNELATIHQRWLFVRIDTGLPWRELLPWAMPVALALLTVLTVLVLANRRLRRAHEAAEGSRTQAERATAARGRFLAYLAHELRGGVGAIASGAKLLREHPEAMPPKPLLQAMQTSAEQVVRLLEDTLQGEATLAQGTVLKPAMLNLATWWNDTLTPLRLRAQASGVALLDEPPPAVQVSADGMRLAQVLTNLVGNAIKFAPRGRVHAQAQWDASNGRLRIEVRDDGPGIAATDRARLFEPYAQGSQGLAARSGAGLGLAISQTIVRAMDGRITLREAEPGSTGCHFEVEVVLQRA